jgi:hypothetical protein
MPTLLRRRVYTLDAPAFHPEKSIKPCSSYYFNLLTDFSREVGPTRVHVREHGHEHERVFGSAYSHARSAISSLPATVFLSAALCRE